MPQTPLQADSPAETDAEVWVECAARLKLAEEAESINRLLAIEDLEFADGQQWPDDLYNMRKVQRRPSITVNMTGTLVRRVINNMKEQRPRIKVHPVGDGVRIEDAKVANGLIRHVETLSNADVAYDVLGENAVRIGWGYLRIINEYVDEKSFEQELKIVPVRNSLTGYIDPSATMPDGSDMNWFIFSTKMKRADFKRQYPGIELQEWTHGGPGDAQHQWLTKEDVRLAEYYRVKKTKDTLLKLTDGRTIFKSEFDEEVFRLAGIAIAQDRDGKEVKRPTERRQIQWYLINGTQVVDKRDLPGHWIPVVRCEGNVLDLNGEVRRKGMIRDMKDPARMFNYWEPLALDTPIPTPSGWSTMGELREGDQVFNERGKPCRVLGKSPVHIHRPCFRVTFDDDSSIVTDDSHPWMVEERGKRTAKGQTWTACKRTTKELEPGKHFIAVSRSLQTNKARLPIDPYVLGVWLGDGNTATPQITQSDEDIEEMRALLKQRGCNVGMARRYGDRAASFTLHGMRGAFAKEGLLGNKYIPAPYRRASKPQRLSLLQGLMDTDGSCSKSGQCSFTTTNARLALHFAELLRSLGIKAVSCLRKGTVRKFATGESLAQDAVQYSFTTRKPVFRLTRKLSNLGLRREEPRRTQRYRIVSVETVESVPVQCIAVDSASHLFLAGPGMVPTHNTAKTEKLALSSKAPWVGVEGQFDGHPEWDDANQKPYSVLKYKLIMGLDGNPLPNVPPPQRQPAVEVEQGFAEASQSAAKNLMAVAGMPHEPGQDTPGTVVSGIALRRRQAISDISHFQYYDNQTMAIAQVGRILLDLLPFYYGEERMQRIIGEDGVPQMVGINQRKEVSPGVYEIKNNLQVGRYDVVMDTGPGYETKRLEAAENLIDLMKTPIGEVAVKAGADIIVRNMDFPGADDLADRLLPASPQGMQKAMQNLPKEAQGIVTALQQQLQQAHQVIQQQALEIKFKSNIEQGWMRTELQKTRMQSETKVHDTETRSATEIAGDHIKAQAGIVETEIGVVGKIVDSHVKGQHDLKKVEAMSEKAEKGNGKDG